MRVRRKPNLDRRLDAVSKILISEDDIKDKKGQAKTLFNKERPLHVEIGCGKGRFSIGTATNNPHVNLIAVEKVNDVLVMACEKALPLELDNLLYISLDARELLGFFNEGEVERIYLNFSDPWKKTGQYKRRLTYSGFLSIYEKMLSETGELCFKTDNKPLFEFSLRQLKSAGWELIDCTFDLHENGNPEWNVMTEYEENWLGKGAKIHRLVARPKREKEHVFAEV